MEDQSKILKNKKIEERRKALSKLTVKDRPYMPKCSLEWCDKIAIRKNKTLCINHYKYLIKFKKLPTRPRGGSYSQLTEEEKIINKKKNNLKYSNSEKGKLRRKEYRKKYNQIPEKRLMMLARNRINERLRTFTGMGHKKLSVSKHLGCTMIELKAHIESQFYPHPDDGRPMTWENRGFGHFKWHLDHKTALKHFDLTNPEEFKKACHYTNLQPLWQPHNLKKAAK